MTNLEAVQHLAFDSHDGDALMTLYDNIQGLIRATIAVHFGESEEGADAHYVLLCRIAGRAVLYDSGMNLRDWLSWTADVECIRIQNERS